MAWVTVLAPYLRASSWIRLSPAFIEATPAQRSPRAVSGMRMLAMMMSITDGTYPVIEHADESWHIGARAREPSLTVGDRHAEVEHFVDDRAHRRLAHRREHLARNGIERALDDLDGHGIKAGFPFHRSTSSG